MTKLVLSEGHVTPDSPRHIADLDKAELQRVEMDDIQRNPGTVGTSTQSKIIIGMSSVVYPEDLNEENVDLAAATQLLRLTVDLRVRCVGEFVADGLDDRIAYFAYEPFSSRSTMAMILRP